MFFDLFRSITQRAAVVLMPSTRRTKIFRSNVELLHASDWFDSQYYLDSYPDVANAHIDPVEHYLLYGATEGRQPSAMFDGVAYLDENPDVKRAGVNPLIHYLRFGQAEGRQARPYVTPVLEMATMPLEDDSCEAVALHVEEHRFAEERQIIKGSGLFDADFYRRTYPDIEAAGVDPLDHYIEHGGKEGRRPHRFFDPRYYTATYSDVRESGIHPLIHYLTIGKKEGRRCGERQLIEESGLFDADFYRRTYPDIEAAGVDPLDHYIEHGGREGRRPHALFDPRWYASAYSDVRESGLLPLIHYLTIGKREGRSYCMDTRILESVEKMIVEAGSIEPTILLDPALAEPSRLAFNYGGQDWSAIHAWQDLFASIKHPFDHIVFVPWLVRGGADLAASNAVKAAIEAHGRDSTLIVLTDYERADAIDWLPEGTHVRVFSDFGRALTRDDRTLMVESLIRSIQPKSILNVNSGACWDAIVRRGGALEKATDLYAFLFCRDYTADGRAAGYADTHFREALPHLKKVYFDNEAFLKEMVEEVGVPPTLQPRMVTLYQPIRNAPNTMHSGGPGDRNSVIWAGRFCTQKNVDLLIEIVENAPDFNFNVFGYGDEQYTEKLRGAAQACSNLRLMGPFTSIADLPLNDYNAFLFTSLWEGLPLTLVEVAAAGIPVVASSVGGIPELVTHETGWLIESYKDAQPYIKALNQIQNEPSLAISKGMQMRQHARRDHSWERFTSMLSISPSFID